VTDEETATASMWDHSIRPEDGWSARVHPISGRSTAIPGTAFVSVNCSPVLDENGSAAEKWRTTCWNLTCGGQTTSESIPEISS